jgi:predicted DNA-binding protein (MmcQ/YjbR family)
VVVFKSNGKIFLLLPLDTEDVRFNVKCDPEQAILQRQEYPDCILPGYHMNKKHWNTIIVDGRLSNSQLQNLISDSHLLINTKPKRKG